MKKNYTITISSIDHLLSLVDREIGKFSLQKIENKFVINVAGGLYRNGSETEKLLIDIIREGRGKAEIRFSDDTIEPFLKQFPDRILWSETKRIITPKSVLHVYSSLFDEFRKEQSYTRAHEIYDIFSALKFIRIDPCRIDAHITSTPVYELELITNRIDIKLWQLIQKFKFEEKPNNVELDRFLKEFEFYIFSKENEYLIYRTISGNYNLNFLKDRSFNTSMYWSLPVNFGAFSLNNLPHLNLKYLTSNVFDSLEATGRHLLHYFMCKIPNVSYCNDYGVQLAYKQFEDFYISALVRSMPDPYIKDVDGNDYKYYLKKFSLDPDKMHSFVEDVISKKVQSPIEALVFELSNHSADEIKFFELVKKIQSYGFLQGLGALEALELFNRNGFSILNHMRSVKIKDILKNLDKII